MYVYMYIISMYIEKIIKLTKYIFLSDVYKLQYEPSVYWPNTLLWHLWVALSQLCRPVPNRLPRLSHPLPAVCPGVLCKGKSRTWQGHKCLEIYILCMHHGVTECEGTFCLRKRQHLYIFCLSIWFLMYKMFCSLFFFF